MWTLETTITAESNDSRGKLAPPPHPAFSFIKNLAFFHYNNLIHVSALSSVRNSNKFSFDNLKSGSHLPKKKYVICFIESSLKMTNFFFVLKSLFVVKIFKFLSWLFGHVEKTAWLDFKIHDVTTWLRNNWNIHIAQYVIKYSNKTMKLGQLIDYNKRNNFLHKLYRKWGREASSRPLFIFKVCLIWGKSNWSAT